MRIQEPLQVNVAMPETPGPERILKSQVVKSATCSSLDLLCPTPVYTRTSSVDSRLSNRFGFGKKKINWQFLYL